MENYTTVWNILRDNQGWNLDLVTFIQARKILQVAFSRRQNVKTKLE